MDFVDLLMGFSVMAHPYKGTITKLRDYEGIHYYLFLSKAHER